MTVETHPGATRRPRAKSADAARPDHEIVVIGAGFSGIGAVIKLKERGFDDVVILEMGDDLGGAWHHNTYPGVAVDTPSLAYSFSFEQNPSWSRMFAPGAELKAYADHCVDKYDVRRHIRLREKVVAADFDERTHLWKLALASGETLRARYVINATGVFTKPKRPDIAGLDSFAGTIMHTAEWDHSVDLKGKRVAVIGTGASAVQVVPTIAPDVAHLDVFQRTAIWILPKTDPVFGPRVEQLFQRLPAAQWAARFMALSMLEAVLVLAFHYARDVPWLRQAIVKSARDHLKRQVPDEALRRKLTPNYDFGCKRPAVSNRYLRAFNRDNVSLITEPIERITKEGIKTQDGVVHPADVLILATGFRMFEPEDAPYQLRGLSGMSLAELWVKNRSQTYQGVSVPGFPNTFAILAPYGWNGTSYFSLIETQMRHIVRLLEEARRRRATYVEVTQEASDAYLASMRARRDHQIFFNADCKSANSYYFDRHGDVPFRAATSFEAWWKSGHFPLSHYRFEARPNLEAQVLASGPA